MLLRSLLLACALFPASGAAAFSISRSPASSVAFASASNVRRSAAAGTITRLYSTEEFRDGKKKKVRSDSTPEEDAAAETGAAADEGSADATPVDPEEPLLQSEGDSDILNSPAFLRRKADVLKSDLEKIEAQINTANAQLVEAKAEWGPDLDRLQNEYLNIQDRMVQQNKEGNPAATVEVVRKILDVLDNYDRAFGAVVSETEEQKAVELDYKKTQEMLYEILKKLGVTEVPTVGTEFDYEVHQAVMQRPSEEYEEGIVCEELAKGFVLGDKLIRAAMVSVAA